MKKRLDPAYVKISLYVFGTAAAIILFWRLLDSSDDLWQSLRSTVSFLRGMLTPFFLALALAYILSPAAGLLERLMGRIWRGETHRRRVRIASILVIYAALAALVAVAIYYVIPGIVRNLSELMGNLSGYAAKATDFYNELLEEEPFRYFGIRQHVDEAIEKGREFIAEWGPNIIPGLFRGLMSVIGGVINGILGVVLSLYLLLERAHIGDGVRRTMQSLIGQERMRRIASLLSAADKVFGRYISSRLLESLIVFALAQTAFLIIGVRYSVLMSAVVALTNLVPYVGPIIGGAFPVVFTLLDNPVRALVVFLVLLVIQGTDAYFISPRLMGDKLGMSPFWVLLVIIVGGGFFGIWGILLAVPVAAVIRLILTQSIRARSMKQQKQENDSPVP